MLPTANKQTAVHVVTVCLSSVHSLHSTVCNKCKTLLQDFSVAHLYEHMRHVALLQQLHWLPVLSRVQFELCTLTYDIRHGTAPQYLVQLCKRCDDSWLRSREQCNFKFKWTQLHLADKAFSIAGPHVFSFPYFFVSVQCAKLGWPSRQLLSAHKSTALYRTPNSGLVSSFLHSPSNFWQKRCCSLDAGFPMSVPKRIYANYLYKSELC